MPKPDLAQDVGRLLQAMRARTGLSQDQVAQLAGTSQQWLSRVERGGNSARLRDVERLFSALGLRLQLQAIPVTAGDDPDLLADMSDADRLLVLDGFRYALRKFSAIPHVIAGRLAAMAQGVPVRVTRLDLAVTDRGLDGASLALAEMGSLRWSDRWQEFCEYDVDPRRPGPMRWRLSGYLELRLTIHPELPAAVTIRLGEHVLPVVPVARLVAADEDVAELVRRLGR